MVGWSLTIVKGTEEDCGGVICSYRVICPKGPRKAIKWPFYHYLYTFLLCFSLLELAEIKRLTHPNGRLGSAVMKVRQTVQLTVLGRGGGSGSGSISCSASIS